jgi:hypothetical protein
MKRVSLGLLVLAAAPAAQAQAQSEFERFALTVAGACLNSGSTPEEAPAAVTTCGKMLVDLDALKSAAPDIAGHDLNVYNIVRGMGLTRVAASFGRIDGVRSARVCERTEEAWTHTAMVKPAFSSQYADMIQNLVTQTAATIRTCRLEFGTPEGGWPLPG